MRFFQTTRAAGQGAPPRSQAPNVCICTTILHLLDFNLSLTCGAGLGAVEDLHGPHHTLPHTSMHVRPAAVNVVHEVITEINQLPGSLKGTVPLLKLQLG